MSFVANHNLEADLKKEIDYSFIYFVAYMYIAFFSTLSEPRYGSKLNNYAYHIDNTPPFIDIVSTPVDPKSKFSTFAGCQCAPLSSTLIVELFAYYL